jgi:hypothetical protein
MWRNKEMIMTKLYPIGTQLITSRYSQVTLYMELIGNNGSVARYADRNVFGCEDNYRDPSNKNWSNYDLMTDYSNDELWRVTVTKKNQKWLSPVPIVGDLVDVYKEYSVPTIIYFSKFEFELLENPSAVVKRIIERRYPNGQRAPLIKWDEVILPTGQTPDSHPVP